MGQAAVYKLYQLKLPLFKKLPLSSFIRIQNMMPCQMDVMWYKFYDTVFLICGKCCTHGVGEECIQSSSWKP